MDKEIAISLAFLNLDLNWNKLEFRKQLEPKKSSGITQQQKDLEQIKYVLNHVVKENRALNKKLMQIEIELMQTQKKLNDYKEIYD
jgi:septal ring factor EnvC (AmiA/AmiB activator)